MCDQQRRGVPGSRLLFLGLSLVLLGYVTHSTQTSSVLDMKRWAAAEVSLLMDPRINLCP